MCVVGSGIMKGYLALLSSYLSTYSNRGIISVCACAFACRHDRMWFKSNFRLHLQVLGGGWKAKTVQSCRKIDDHRVRQITLRHRLELYCFPIILHGLRSILDVREFEGILLHSASLCLSLINRNCSLISLSYSTHRLIFIGLFELTADSTATATQLKPELYRTMMQDNAESFLVYWMSHF